MHVSHHCPSFQRNRIVSIICHKSCLLLPYQQPNTTDNTTASFVLVATLPLTKRQHALPSRSISPSCCFRVAQDAIPVLVGKEVRGFDVAVHNATIMDGFDGGDSACQVLSCLPDFAQGRAGALFEQVELAVHLCRRAEPR